VRILQQPALPDPSAKGYISSNPELPGNLELKSEPWLVEKEGQIFADEHHGQHLKVNFEFEYQLPTSGLPQSFSGNFGNISYWVIALLQGNLPVWTMQRISVLPNNDAVDTFGPDCMHRFTSYADHELRYSIFPSNCRQK
jgi:hypothetical protein